MTGPHWSEFPAQYGPGDPLRDERRGGHRALHPSRRAVSRWVWISLGIAVAVTLVMAVFAACSEPDNPKVTTAGAPVVLASSTPTATVPAPTAPASADLPEGAFGGDGTYVVGTDVPAGAYRSVGPVIAGDYAYWARCRPRTNCRAITDVVENSRSRGPATVFLRDGQVFLTDGFQPWYPVR